MQSRASISTAPTGSRCGAHENLFQPDFARWSAAVTVEVPLFDGWRTAGRVAQARAERNTVTQQIAALENQVRLDVQSAWDALALANRTIKAADLNVTQARRAAEMTEANYRLGAATPLDVIDAQQALRQAENIRNQALVRARERARVAAVRDGAGAARLGARVRAKGQGARDRELGEILGAMRPRFRSHLLMAALAGIAGAAACGGTEAETPAVETNRTIPVRTATVETRDLTETLSLTGTLDPRAEVVVVPEVSARLERVLRNEGDRVCRGQVLAVLDCADFRLARDRARAQPRSGRGQSRAREGGEGSRRQPR